MVAWFRSPPFADSPARRAVSPEKEAKASGGCRVVTTRLPDSALVLAVRQGSTALFWRCPGRSAALDFALLAHTAHRACGRVFDAFAVISFYGDAQHTDGATLSAEALLNPAVLLFVAQPHHQCSPGFGRSHSCRWAQLPSLPYAAVSASPVAGVPHHLAVSFAVPEFAATVLSPVQQRYRRCALYSGFARPLSKKPTPFSLPYQLCLPTPVCTIGWPTGNRGLRPYVKKLSASVLPPATSPPSVQKVPFQLAVLSRPLLPTGMVSLGFARVETAPPRCQRARSGQEAALTPSQVRH